MERTTDGVWATRPHDPALTDFRKFDHAPYMFRVTKDSGKIVYRTDLFSRCQIGYGTDKPTGSCTGLTRQLDGTVSCSVVVDPRLVTTQFLEPVWRETQWTEQEG